MRAPVAILCALSLLGCDGATSPGVRIELVDPAGENAALGIIEGTLSIELRQGDQLLCDEGCDAEIRGGEFELTLPIQSLVELTTIHGSMSGGDEPLQGVVPPFAVAGEGLETAEVPVRLVMMPAARCEPLELFNVSTAGRPRLVEPRRDAVPVVRRNIVLLGGGTGVSGGSSRIDLFDQVVMEMRPPLESPAGPLGRTVGLALSENESLFVGDSAWIYVSQMGPPGATSIDVHAGADGTSALVLVTGIAGIIGGTDTREISWVTARGTALPGGMLTVERSGAVAATGSRDGALVVGGAPGGEWISPANAPIALTDPLPDASGGWLVVSPSGQSYLWVGATGSDTHLITECPGACNVSAGPTWDRARDGAAGTSTAAGAFWIVGGEGSDLVDIVRWDGERPSFDVGPTLSSVRAGASVVEHASGVILVMGGQQGSDFLDTVELCSPVGLDAL